MAALRELAGRLWREHASPPRLAAAVAVGVIVGCSPFFGLHLWIGLALAVLLRLNKVAVFVGSQISIPPLAPLLGFASVQVGSLILEGRLARLTLEDFQLARLFGLVRGFLLDWVVGGLVVGVALAIPALAVTWTVARRRARRARTEEAATTQAWRRDLAGAAARYARARRPHRFYAWFKYRMDPLYREVCERMGPVECAVDLGTGLGMLPVLLALRGQARRVVGVDWDAEKVASGRLASADLAAVELVAADLRGYALPGADAVVLADVLHYWPLEEQRAILRRAAAALGPGGRLFVRETDRRARSWLTRALEGIAVRTGWNRGPGLTYRTEEELRQELEQLGLRCECAEASSTVHQGNVLLWGRRPAPDAGSGGAAPETS